MGAKQKKGGRGRSEVIFLFVQRLVTVVDSEALLQETRRKCGSSLQSTVPTRLFHGLIAPVPAGFIRCKFLTLGHRQD